MTQDCTMAKTSNTYQIATDIEWQDAGEGYFVAPNLAHGCVCLEAGVLIDTFSPMREDFLK